MQTLGVKGIPDYSRGSRSFCKSRVVGKSTTANLNRESTRINDPPTCFHTLTIYIWGPDNIPASGNFNYFFGAFCIIRTVIIMIELLK
jgi:hypothetical protein